MFKYIKVIFKVLGSLIFAYFSWIRKYSNHPEKYPLEERFLKAQKLIQKVLKAFGVVYDSTEFDDYEINLKDDRNHLIISNHLSDADPLIYVARARRPLTFVAKIETKKYIFVGRVIKLLDGEFLDRNDLKQNFIIMQNVQKKLVRDEKLDIVIFAEGTRNKNIDDLTVNFHYGSFKPAIKENVPIDVFAIFGTNKIFSFKSNKSKYFVKIRKVISFSTKDYIDKKSTDIAIISSDLTSKKLIELKNNSN